MPKFYTLAFDELMNAIAIEIFDEKKFISLFGDDEGEIVRQLLERIRKSVKESLHEKGK